ncbi:MAG: PilW family protein [Planctomycetota bacterium]|jgi:prepilin-type N-terminal cleavage/methylation domain-containing protein
MKRRGFTLIELLIAIVLMIILLSALTLIFVRTTETVAIAEARENVYVNARWAMDIMQRDLTGCIKYSSGNNRFIMENGMISTGADTTPRYAQAGNPVAGNHTNAAADRMTFRTTTIVGDTVKTCEITYELIRGDKAIDNAGNIVNGNPGNKVTLRTGRPIYTLIRRTRLLDSTVTDVTLPWDEVPTNAGGEVINDGELCHYVLSFNLEYLSSTPADPHQKNFTFSQLEPSYFTPEAGRAGYDTAGMDPLGNDAGINDTVGTIADPVSGMDVTTPLRVAAIRVTIVVVDSNAERQERIFQRVIMIPMG